MPIPTLYSKDSVDNLLADKLDLAGGTMTGGLTLSATGIIFSDATTMTTAPAGGTLAADQLTAGVVATNPAAGPTTAGDVLQYDGTDLIWAAGGGGGGLTISTLSNGATSTLNATAPTTGQALTYDGTDLIWAAGGGGVAWGAITGTVTDQTDLVTYVTGLGYQTAGDVSTYVSANAYPLSGNPSGFLTSVPGKTISSLTGNTYTIVAGDANNIVYVPAGIAGGFPPIDISVPDDATYNFAVGTTITVVVNNSTGASDVNLIPLGFGVPTLLGTVQIPSGSASGIMEMVKVAADLWIIGKLS